jgi:hypothetical protein
MLKTRGFLHITYKIYHHLDIIDGEICLEKEWI